MTQSPAPQTSNARAFWLGMLFWSVVCIAGVLLRGVRWEEGYERAQALLAITPYPEGHPLHRWAWNAFSIQYYGSGALLWITDSAAWVCGIRQILAALATHLPVFAIAWLLARNALAAHTATLLGVAGANTIFQSYMPIAPWATKATSGIIGMGWGLGVLALLAAGRWRAAGLGLGLMPLIHLGQWPVLLLTAIALGAWLAWKGERVAARGLLLGTLAGLVLCGLFALAQRPLLVPDPTTGAYAGVKDANAVWAEYTTHEDMHRAIGHAPRFGPAGNSIIALVGILVLGLPWAWRELQSDQRRGPAATICLYAFLGASAMATAQIIHRLMGTDVPYAVVSWMPNRLVIHISMLLLCGVSAWNARPVVLFAAVAWLAALPLWPHVLPEAIASRYFSAPETAVFLLAGGALAGGWTALSPWPFARRVWIVLAASGWLALTLYHQVAALAAFAGLLLALAATRFDHLPAARPWCLRLSWVAGAMALTGILYGLHGTREHLPVSDFERQARDYLSAHAAPGDMVLTPLDERYQMALNQPVVATFETRQFMTYMRSLAATIDRLYAELYGVRDDRWYDWDLWQQRTGEEWAALGRDWGFHYVISKDFHPLQLPERVRVNGLVLYEVPKAQEL